MVEQNLSGRKILVLFVCVIQTLIAVGLVYGFSVMFSTVVNVFRTSRTNAALIQGTFVLVFSGGGILWTWTLKLYGTGYPVVFGSVVASIGFIASSFATNILTIIVCTGVISGMGICLIYLATFVTVNMTFQEDPSFPIVLVTIGSSLGQMIMPLVYDALLSAFHWSGAMILLAGISFNCVPCGLVVVFSKEVCSSSSKEDACSPSAVCDRELLANAMFWLFLLNVLILFTTANFANWFLVDQMISIGFTHNSSTSLLTIAGSANLIARILCCIIKLKVKGTKRTTLYHWLYACPVIAVSQGLILALQANYKRMIFACFAHGFGYGLINSYVPIVVHELSGHDKYPQAIAQLNLVLGISNLLSNIIGGCIRDTFENYDVMYEIAIGAALLVTLGVIMMICIIKQCRKDSMLHSGQKEIASYNSVD